MIKIENPLTKIIRRGKDKVLDKDYTNVVYKICCNDYDAFMWEKLK